MEKQWLSRLVELERQLARPDLQQARGIAMIGAGIVERCDTVEEFPHLGFACRLADNRKDRLLQGSRHSRDAGWSFSGKRLTIEFSFAGDDDVGALDFGAQLDRFRDHLEARSDDGAAKGEKPKAKAARCSGPRDIAVIVVKYFAPQLLPGARGSVRGSRVAPGWPLFARRRSASHRADPEED